MASLQEKLEAIWKSHATRIQLIGRILGKVAIIMFIAYMSASTLTAMTVGLFSKAALSNRTNRASDVERPQLRKNLNYLEVRRSVVGRNIFNSDGELPDEAGPNSDSDNLGSGNFDASGPCQKSSLPIELLGTIISGDASESLVTVREKGFNIADVYRQGDAILGHDQVLIYAVEARRLVLNNSGNKECVELKEIAALAGALPTTPSSAAGRNQAPASEAQPVAGGSSTVSLEGSYIEDALGPGFAKILEAGRLVPFNRDSSMVGFKLIGAKNDSLWQRMGLNSGDVITSVNGISMAQPEQGFAIFEALQNEREIRVEFLQKGTSPSNITVEIK